MSEHMKAAEKLGGLIAAVGVGIGFAIALCFSPPLIVLAAAVHFWRWMAKACRDLGICDPLPDPVPVVPATPPGMAAEEFRFRMHMALKPPTMEEVKDASRAAAHEHFDVPTFINPSGWELALCRALLAARRDDRGL